MAHEPHLGFWIKHQRELLGVTQSKFVDTLRNEGFQLSRSHLANIEAGTYAAPAELIRAIAALRGLDVRDTQQYVSMLPRTRKEPGPTLHEVSPVADTGPPPRTGVSDAPEPLNPLASATELLDWARNKLASLASVQPGQIVLTTTGPLADALRAAPPPGGYLGGLLGIGIRAVLERGAELHHILAVSDDPEAHFELLAQALPLAARYCLPPSSSRPYLSRYSLTLVAVYPPGPDLVVNSSYNQASMIVPVLSAGKPGIAVVEIAPQGGRKDSEPNQSWASDYASWLAARGTDLFSWVTVAPTGSVNMPSGPWEDVLAPEGEHIGGQDSIQRMLRLNIMSEDLRSQLIASQERRRRDLSPESVKKEVIRRMSIYKDRRSAMIRNLKNGYRYRNVVTREALDDLAKDGQYTMERLPDNVLTAAQAASYLQTTIDLIRSFDNFEVLILTDEQLQQALPLGASWIVKRSPPNQATSSQRAWAFLPYAFNDKAMAMNVVVDDERAIEAIGNRIDVLWTTWNQGRTVKDIREETLAGLKQAQRDIAILSSVMFVI